MVRHVHKRRAGATATKPTEGNGSKVMQAELFVSWVREPYSIPDAIDALASEAWTRAMSVHLDAARVEGIHEVVVKPSVGLWEGDLEPGLHITVKADKLEDVLRQAEVLRGAWDQDAVMVAVSDPSVEPTDTIYRTAYPRNKSLPLGDDIQHIMQVLGNKDGATIIPGKHFLTVISTTPLPTGGSEQEMHVRFVARPAEEV